MDNGAGKNLNNYGGDKDPLYFGALRLCMQKQDFSISFIQRIFSISFMRAALIRDAFIENSIIARDNKAHIKALISYAEYINRYDIEEEYSYDDNKNSIRIDDIIKVAEHLNGQGELNDILGNEETIIQEITDKLCFPRDIAEACLSEILRLMKGD